MDYFMEWSEWLAIVDKFPKDDKIVLDPNPVIMYNYYFAEAPPITDALVEHHNSIKKQKVQ